MKKSLLIILLIILINNSFSQTKTEITFANHDPYNWSNITFYSDSSFTYSCWACKGGGESKGTYKIHDKTLTLYYESVDTLKSYSTEKITCPPTNPNYFNTYQFNFKKGDKQIYTIKKWKEDEIVLTFKKSDLHFWRKKDI